jgi:hypothetical protein
LGNDGTLELDYQSSSNTRTFSGPGQFRHGFSAGLAQADFAPANDWITSYNQGSAAGSYRVRRGDTLQSIAASNWGDASLWYKLAEANGLGAGSALIEGQNLVVPAGVIRHTNNASTFKPYDAAEAMGDTSPTAAKPQKGNNCGAMGQIMIAVVAIAVTAALPIVSGFFSTFAGSVLGGAIAGAASQGFGVAVGIQHNFNWKSIAMAAVSAGVSGGLDRLGAFRALGIAGSGTVAQAAQGAVGSAVAQGIGVATRLQSKFDFAAVAAAAAGAAAGAATRGRLKAGGMDGASLRFFGGVADDIAGAAARSLTTGTSFGDNLIAVLPSVIGRTIGMALDEALGRNAPGPAGKVKTGGPKNQNSAGLAKQEAGSSQISLSAHPAMQLGPTISTSDLVAAAAEGNSGNADPLIPLAEGGTGNLVESIVARADDPRMNKWFSTHVWKYSAESVLEHLQRDMTSIEQAGQIMAVADRAAGAFPNKELTTFITRTRQVQRTLDGMVRKFGEAISFDRQDLERAVRRGVRAAATERVKRLAYALTTAAIASPFTTDTAADILREWRDGTANGDRIYRYNSRGSRELVLGYSGDYIRGLSSLGLEQMVAHGGGTIRDGDEITLEHLPAFGVSDGLNGMRDGINIADVIGTFTYGVTARARGDYVYFRGRNAMSLESFSGENLLNHGLVDNPTSGPFSTTVQVIEWRVPIPAGLRPPSRTRH